MPDAPLFPPSAMTMNDYERFLEEECCEPLPQTEYVGIDVVITWLAGRGLDLYAVEFNRHLFGSVGLSAFRELTCDLAGALEAEFGETEEVDGYRFWRATNQEELKCLQNWISITGLDPADLSRVAAAIESRLIDHQARHSDIARVLWNVVRRGGVRLWARQADPQSGILASTDWQQVPSEFFSDEFAFCEHDGLYPYFSVGDRSFVRPGDARPAWRHPRMLRLDTEFLIGEVKGHIDEPLSGAAAERYYEHRVSSWPPDMPPPSRKADLKACENAGMTHATHRAVRAKLAPPDWKKAGRKKRDAKR